MVETNLDCSQQSIGIFSLFVLFLVALRPSNIGIYSDMEDVGGKGMGCASSVVRVSEYHYCV